LRKRVNVVDKNSMIVLVLNSGSSSLKYQLLDMPREELLTSGRVERIGEQREEPFFLHKRPGREEVRSDVFFPDHRSALETILDRLADPDQGCLDRGKRIEAVGHRVVHGRDLFSEPVLVTDEALSRMREITELAPLQMPHSLSCIEVIGERLPGVPQVALFDTAFYRSLPEHAYRYPVPQEWYERYHVRRYGFHGTSHQYVIHEASALLGIPLERLRVISAHLGNGASITAFREGGVLDTSMGFTPLEGLMMGTRAGQLDPAVIPYIMSRTGRSAEEVLAALNRDSGLIAVSGVGRDMRNILEARDRGDERAALAFRMFIHILRKYTGAYFFALGGADAFVFTGGIGEHSPEVRAALFENLAPLGFAIDAEKNRSVRAGRAADISDPSSRVNILVIPTNEELLIARETCRRVTSAPV
jgi:acetate kinase